MKNKAVVFDLDGTLSNGTHRLHLLPNKNDAHRTSAWDAFNLASKYDTPIKDNVELLRSIHSGGMQIIILSGRGMVAFDNTLHWLAKHNIPYNRLSMRPINDNRTDIDYKLHMLKKLSSMYDIVACFDDLAHIVTALRNAGYTAHQVTDYGPVDRVDIIDHRTIREDYKEPVVCNDVASSSKPNVPDGGMKYDKDKPRTDLLTKGMPDALLDVARALTMGAKKYAEDSWKTVDNGHRRYLAALMRHLLQYEAGEQFDSESGLSHLTHIATNALFILQLQLDVDKAKNSNREQ